MGKPVLRNVYISQQFADAIAGEKSFDIALKYDTKYNENDFIRFHIVNDELEQIGVIMSIYQIAQKEIAGNKAVLSIELATDEIAE